MPSRIEDYALIGDCKSAALVSRDGSIDWLCWPRFDSEACFAALLGTNDNGRWLVAAQGEAKISRCYRPDTLILETTFETADGAVKLIDFMPFRTDYSEIVRMVVGIRGTVAMRTELILRFGYGAVVPWVTKMENGALRAIAGPDMTVLRTPVHLKGKDMTTVGEFKVSRGETVPLILTYSRSHKPLPQSLDPSAALRDTEKFWTEWAAKCRPAGDWSDAVRRSIITLKALTYQPTGGIVARAYRRRAQLGLPLLLAARRHAHAARRHACRLLRGSGSVAGMAAAGGRRKPRPNSDHVRHRRRAPARRMGGGLAARL
jgi:GH15 family glucan-1,4-alpha-glucosidase